VENAKEAANFKLLTQNLSRATENNYETQIRHLLSMMVE